MKRAAALQELRQKSQRDSESSRRGVAALHACPLAQEHQRRHENNQSRFDPEGRALCLALAVYAFSIFGYVTAALASFLVEQSKPAGEPTPQNLHEELARLRRDLARLAKSLDERGERGGR